MATMKTGDVQRQRRALFHTRTNKSHVVSVHAQEGAARLPAISGAAIEAITNMLMTEQSMKRPPEKAAALLALTVELYKHKEPFPTREAAAYALNCSVFTVDAVLSTRIDEGYLTQVVETETGNVAARRSTVRRRYYVPSDALISVADSSTKRG